MKKPLLRCILDGFGWVPDQTYGKDVYKRQDGNSAKLTRDIMQTVTQVTDGLKESTGVDLQLSLIHI